jgi:hypothetical protein
VTISCYDLGVFVDLGLVLDILRTVGVAKCAHRFIVIVSLDKDAQKQRQSGDGWARASILAAKGVWALTAGPQLAHITVFVFPPSEAAKSTR